VTTDPNDQTQQIIDLRDQGRSVREIAAEVGLSKSAVGRIITRDSARAELARRQTLRDEAALAARAPKPKPARKRPPRPTTPAQRTAAAEREALRHLSSGSAGRVLGVMTVPQHAGVELGLTGRSPTWHGADTGELRATETYADWLTRRDRERAEPPDPGPAVVETPTSTFTYDALDHLDIARVATLVADDLPGVHDAHVREALIRVGPGGRIRLQ
jgi:hypothetical protein